MSGKTIITRRGALQALSAGGFGLGLAARSRPAAALDQRSTFMPAEPSRLAEHSLLCAVALAGDRFVAVGGRGIVLLSDDFGGSWRQARDVPTQTTLTAVTFVTPETGFAVGHDEVILKTEDGGESWTMRYVDAERGSPLLTIGFTDAKHGLAMGGFGIVLETGDGGWRWRERALRRGEVDDLSLNKILSVGDAVYVASDQGRVYRQSGEGGDFQPVQAPTESAFWDAIALRDGGLAFCGAKGEVWRAHRDLTGWSQFDSPDVKGFTALALTLDGRLAAAGLAGALAFAGDEGDKLLAARLPEAANFAALTAGPRGKMVLLGESGITLAPDRP